MTKEIDVALDVQKKLLFRLIEKPKEFEKLPRRDYYYLKKRLLCPIKR